MQIELSIPQLQSALAAKAQRDAVRQAIVQTLRTVRADLPDELRALLQADEQAGVEFAAAMGVGQ